MDSTSAIKMYEEIKGRNATVISAVKNLFERNKTNQLPFLTGSIQGQSILQFLMLKVDQYLPNYPTKKRTIFLKILEEVIRYTRATSVGYEKKRFSFLYSKSERVGGVACLGEDASEEDLQDSMLAYFQHSKIADGLDHEKAKFVDGGRVDIVYSNNIMTIPIELKKSLSRP